jgi:hypothetical protein
MTDTHHPRLSTARPPDPTWTPSKQAIVMFACVVLSLVLVTGLSSQPGFATPVHGHALHGRAVHASAARQNGAVPGRPTHLTAKVQNGDVVLTWRQPAVTATTGTPTDYLVIWQAPPVLPLLAEADTHSTATTYTSVFGSGTYEVAAKNAKGTGPPSKPVTICDTQSRDARVSCDT